jgi:hypothetical protein
VFLRENYATFERQGSKLARPFSETLDHLNGLGHSRDVMSFDPHPPAPSARSMIFFERRELMRLLDLYGRRVAAGEWRDYAIDGLADYAVFSIYRRSSEQPLYRIEKRPELARRQGAWSVVGQGGIVLRRGHELEQVLKVFDTRKFKVVD